MLGVILFDSSQRIPIYWSPRMTREFVDGVLDVVLADRASQFSYVVGPPAMYRGSIVQSSSSNQNNNNSQNNDSSSSSDHQNGNSSSTESSKKISNALLHSSLLCGVVESHGKIAHEQQQQQQASMMNGMGGDGFNSSTTTRGSDVAGNGGGGFIRPPHYPRLVRSKNTVPLTKTAVSPTCPNVSRFVQTQAPTPLTKAQINSSKALNEGCVALSSNSQHSWLHPSIAPCSTEPVTDWILSYEQSHLRNQSDLKRERIQSYSKLVQEYQKLRVEHQQQQNNNNTASPSNEKYIPSMFYFPWRIFGDSLGVVYCIFSAGPNVPLASNNIPIITTSSSSSSSSPLKKQNSFTTMKANGGGSQNDLLTLAAGGQHQGGSSSSFAHSASQQGNFLTSDSFAGFFGGGGAAQQLYASSASPDASPTKRGGNSHHHHQTNIDPTILSSLPKHFHHEENMPAVQQSMSNLLVLLCDAFKTTKSAEAPMCKSLISNLDQVHECVEIVCPGNGRCMPVLDTSAVRKVWKMRNEYAN